MGSREDVWTSLFYTGLVGTVILTAIMPFYWQPLDTVSVLLMLAIAACGTVGQLSLIRAFSQGEAGMLAPYAYVGLIFAGLWSTLFFDEWPTPSTVAGSRMIAGAVLSVWYRETYRRT